MFPRVIEFHVSIFIDSLNDGLVLQVTTVQLSNTTDRNLTNTGLRQDYPNGPLLRSFEQQQDKGTKNTIHSFRAFLGAKLRTITARTLEL